MNIDTKKLVSVLKAKRVAEGLSLRKLSGIIGVSFSTLARIERGDGDPDNNSALRILDWLGADGVDAGLSYENVAFVHFRAAKNTGSMTVRCLLKAAEILKRQYVKRTKFSGGDNKQLRDLTTNQDQPLALSKPEMEAMATDLRNDLRLSHDMPLDALALSIEGVDVVVPSDVSELDANCLTYLLTTGAKEWSAMSVPLEYDEDRWVILRNDQHNVERQRVTYLEECWHILLGHKLTKIAKVAGGYGRSYESSEEHDAYYLASATLLPAEAVSQGVSEKLSASEIASRFGTSPELVEYRIKRLGLWRSYKGLQIKLGTIVD